jgi:hypothetical protein
MYAQPGCPLQARFAQIDVLAYSMPQMHLYLPKSLAEEVRRRAEIKGVSTSAYLAEVIKAEIDDSWPPGYLEEVIGCTQQAPLQRGEQGAWEERDALQ